MEVNYSGTVTAKAMGKNALIGDTNAAAAITLKQQVQNTLCEIKLTDASIRGRPFQDILLKAVTKPRSMFSASAVGVPKPNETSRESGKCWCRGPKGHDSL